MVETSESNIGIKKQSAFKRISETFKRYMAMLGLGIFNSVNCSWKGKINACKVHAYICVQISWKYKLKKPFYKFWPAQMVWVLNYLIYLISVSNSLCIYWICGCAFGDEFSKYYVNPYIYFHCSCCQKTCILFDMNTSKIYMNWNMLFLCIVYCVHMGNQQRCTLQKT